MAQRFRDGQGSFRGGLNTTNQSSVFGALSVLALAPDELDAMENVVLDESGWACRRLGTRRTSASAVVASTPVRAGVYWESQNLIVVICNGRAYTATYSPTLPWTWTARGAAADFSSSVNPSMTPFRDGSTEVLYIADGGLLNKMGTGGTPVTINIAGTPSVSQIAVFNLRLFGIGDPSNPNRLYWSALNNGDTLGDTGSGGGFADIRAYSPSAIVQIMPLGNSLLIFHKKGISRFLGWGMSDFSVDDGTRGMAPHLGIEDARQVCSADNMVFYVSNGNRVYGVNEAGSLVEAALGLHGRIGPLVTPTSSRLLLDVANNEVLLAVSGLGLYHMHREHTNVKHPFGVWSGEHSDPGSFLVGNLESWWVGGNRHTVFLGGTDGFVREYQGPNCNHLDDVLSDGSGGSASLFRLRTRAIGSVDHHAFKANRYLFMNVYAQGELTLNVEERIAGGTSPSAVSVAVTPFVGNAHEYRSHLGGRGHHTQIEIEESTAGESLAIAPGITIEGFMYPRRMRR